MLKRSKYNYLIKYKKGYILFNGFTLKFLLLNNEIKDIIKKIIDEPNNVDKIYLRTRCNLKKNGFIIDAEVDEIEEIKRNKIMNSSKPRYALTIFPTYQCNFSCWYCVQNHENFFMTDSTIELIKKHIEKYIVDNNIKFFEIHWFGGEPLLCFDKHIKEISEFAIKICKENDAIFFNNITTNGFLINKTMAQSMRNLHFKQFQITVDGERILHDKTRNQKGIPSFDTILKNIKLILETIPDVNMFVRYNYTDKNILSTTNMIKEMNEIFPLEYRYRIKITAVKVWQIDKRKFKKNYIPHIYKLFSSNGYNIADVELNSDFLICDAEYKHSYAIFYNGYVDKCNNIKPSDAHYKLMEDGNIKYLKTSPQLMAISSTTNICYNCKYLPICLGPCLKCHLSNISENLCVEKCTEIDNKERIINYCYSKILENKK